MLQVDGCSEESFALAVRDLGRGDGLDDTGQLFGATTANYGQTNVKRQSGSHDVNIIRADIASTIRASSAGTISNTVPPGGITPPIVASLRPVTTPDCAAIEIRILLDQFLAVWNFPLRRLGRGLPVTASTPSHCSGLL